MPAALSATNRYLVQEAFESASNPALIKHGLADAKNGDTAALAMLEEQTGLAPALVKDMVAAYGRGELNDLLEKPSADTAKVAVALGNVGSAKAIGANQSASLKELGISVKPLVAKLERLKPQLAKAEADLKAKKRIADKDEEAADDAKPLFGTGWFRKDATEAYEKLAAVAKTSSYAYNDAHDVALKLRGEVKEVNTAIDSLTRDAYFASLKPAEAAKMKHEIEATNELRETLSLYGDVLSNAASAVKNARENEAGEIFWGGSDWFLPGTDEPIGANALEAAKAATVAINTAITNYNEKLPGKDISVLPGLPDIKSGETADNVGDLLGTAAKSLGRATGNSTLGNIIGTAISTGGSAIAANQLSKIKAAIQISNTKVGSKLSTIKSRLDALETRRDVGAQDLLGRALNTTDA